MYIEQQRQNLPWGLGPPDPRRHYTQQAHLTGLGIGHSLLVWQPHNHMPLSTKRSLRDSREINEVFPSCVNRVQEVNAGIHSQE